MHNNKNNHYIDLTGLIEPGIWTYGMPYPEFQLVSIQGIFSGERQVFAEAFQGMHSQTGTYLETNAHYYGYETSLSIDQIPINDLINIECVVLSIPLDFSPSNSIDKYQRMPITRTQLQEAAVGIDLKPGQAILLDTDWGQYWSEDFFLTKCPYITLDAMKWLLEQKPFLLGSDIPRWENDTNDEGVFPIFYAQDILMLAPLVHLDKISVKTGDLTVLPLHIANTCASPCRVIYCESKA